MNNKCEKCGGELITGRLSTGAHLVTFSPSADDRKLIPRQVRVFCDACSTCGAIYNIRVEDPEKIR